jgi:hypothetical protein
MTKVARFGADEDAGHHLHRERGCNAERRLAQSLPRPAQPRLFGFIADVECSEQAARDQLAIGKHAKFGTVPVGRLSARLVLETPMGLDAERQTGRRVLAIEQTESRVERDGLQRPLAAIINPVHACDVVIGNRRHG